MESGGEKQKLIDTGFAEGDLEKLIAEDGGEKWTKIEDVDYLDTLRRAYNYLKNDDTTEKIANRVIKMLKIYKQHGLVMSKHQADILREAEENLTAIVAARRRRPKPAARPSRGRRPASRRV